MKRVVAFRRRRWLFIGGAIGFVAFQLPAALRSCNVTGAASRGVANERCGVWK